MGIFNPGAGPDAAGVQDAPFDEAVQAESNVEFQAEKNDFLNKLLSNKEKFFRIVGAGAGLCAMLMTGCEKKTPDEVDIKLGKEKIVLNERNSIIREGGYLHIDADEHQGYWLASAGSSPYLCYSSPEKALPAEELATAIMKDYRDTLLENNFKFSAVSIADDFDWQAKGSDKVAEEYPEIEKEKKIFKITDDTKLDYGNQSIDLMEDHELTDAEFEIITHYLAEILKAEGQKENSNIPVGEGLVACHSYDSDDGKSYLAQNDDGSYDYSINPILIEKAFLYYRHDRVDVDPCGAKNIRLLKVGK